jgi:putative membrane protein
MGKYLSMKAIARIHCLTLILFVFRFRVVSSFLISSVTPQIQKLQPQHDAPRLSHKSHARRFLQSIRADTLEDATPRKKKQFKIPIFSRLIHNLDAYRETSRLYRRTVFSDDDWVKYRSSGRLFKNLSTLFISGVIRGIWIEVVMVALVSTCVYLLNLSNIPVVLPTIIFQLTSPALGLLLVFRTNTAYERWKNSRIAWEHIQNHCNNLVRQGMAYLADEEKEEYTRRVIALAFILKAHYRTGAEERDKLRVKITALLGAREAARLLVADVRPVQALSDICRIVRRSTRIDGSTKARFDIHLDEVMRAFITCEGIRSMPVPLIYTRHTGRFLGLWILLLPFALVTEFGGRALIIPVSCLVSLFFFGVEELGLQIEEPFSILPLEFLAARIECVALQMLAHERRFLTDPYIGKDAVDLPPVPSTVFPTS